MAESTLSLSNTALAGEVGQFLGYGRGVALGDPAWNTQQTAVIQSCLDSGLRWFYFPPPTDASGSSYDWSFLKPVASLTLASAATTVALPDDFGSVEGQITVSLSTAIAWFPLDLMGVGSIYQQAAQYPDTTGRPVMCCCEPIKGTSLTAGQRFRLHFWPKADQAYTLQLQYNVHPGALSSSNPYPYGGMQHAETIKAAVIAAAELYVDDAIGPRHAHWMERLTASVNTDRKSKPQLLGYNRDHSDLMGRHRWRDGRWWGDNTITVNGVTY